MADTTHVQLRKLGAAVRNARRATGISQEDFAEVCDVHRTHMGAIERGQVNLSFNSLVKICRALKLRPSELFSLAKL
jgi:transcriptional regulator with XRE-family HTH domain